LKTVSTHTTEEFISLQQEYTPEHTEEVEEPIVHDQILQEIANLERWLQQASSSI
jgi:hypothetical protein